MTNTAVLPVRIAVDHNGNFILIVLSLKQVEGQSALTVYNLLTVNRDGRLVAAMQLAPADLWIDIAVAPDGTLAILYRESSEVLLFEPDDDAPSAPATETPAAGAPFELPGYTFEGSIDLAPHGSDELPIFAQGLAFGADGAVYVGDAATMRLLALDRQGALRFETQLDPAPEAEELFDLFERVERDWSRVANAYVDRITLGSDREYIYRSGIGNRMQRITTDGQVTAEWMPPIMFESGIVGIGFFAVGQDGDIAYASRGDCGIGLLRPDGSAEALALLPNCPPNTPFSIAANEENIFVPLPSAAMPGSIDVVTFDRQGQLIETLNVPGPETSTNEPGAWFPMATNIDAAGNLILLVTTIVGRDAEDQLLMSTHLMTVDTAGAVLSSAEIPSAYQRIDLAVAPDGTLGLLYRDNAEVLLFTQTD